MDRGREFTGDMIAGATSNALALEQIAHKLADSNERVRAERDALRERVRELESAVAEAHQNVNEHSALVLREQERVRELEGLVATSAHEHAIRCEKLRERVRELEAVVRAVDKIICDDEWWEEVEQLGDPRSCLTDAIDAARNVEPSR